jgi:predicted RNA binding protein YcfA (HicA-like mRNA interferase family)
LEKVFLSAGFRFARQQGSHRSYTKPGLSRPIVIPTYDEVPVSIIRNSLKTAGITREEYFVLLEKR